MIKQTSNYDMFKFRPDNRVIDQGHVRKIAESIKAKNMLDLRPIEVTETMEIMDGQHRLMAARSLQVPVYYKVVENVRPEDIILIQTAKGWTLHDYLHYYVQNEYRHYILLQDFMNKHHLSVQNSIIISEGTLDKQYLSFKTGKFVFNEHEFGDKLEIMKQTCEYIKRINGSKFAQYVHSTRFWKAMILLLKHPNFDEKKWFANLGIHVSKFRTLATFQDYFRMVVETFNYKNHNKIKHEEEFIYE